MLRYLPIFGLGLISFGLWGCGGGEPVKPVEQAGANNAPAGAAAADGGMPGGGMPKAGMPGGGAPDGAAAPGGAPGAGPAAVAASGSQQDLFQFIPEELKLAAGADVVALSDKSNPLSPQLLEQFQPVLRMLARAGIKVEKIEHLWTGTNHPAGDVLVCVRTRSAYDSASINKAMGASDTVEKIGRASVRTLPANPDFHNALAYIDTKTLLIGRLTSVTAALKNPKPGPVRLGLEAMALPKAHYWVSGGDDGVSQRLNLNGFEGIEWIASSLPKARGIAMGLSSAANKGADGTPGGAGPAGAPGAGIPPPGGPAGGPPGGISKGERPAGGAGAAGIPIAPPGTTPAGGAAPSAADIEVAVGWSFATEAEATQLETAIGMLKRTLDETAKAVGPAARPGLVAQDPAEQNQQEMRKRMQEQQKNAVPPPAGQALPGQGPPAGMPNVAGMPGGTQAGQGPGLTRTKENLRLTEIFSTADGGPVAKIISRALEASGVPAMDDGLFEGTLSLLNRSFHDWEQAKPDQLVGTRRIPATPIHFGYSWMTELLPFVGHDDLYAKFDFNKSWSDPANRQHAQTVVPAFLNPADPRTTWNGYPYQGMALSHFAGMSGIEDGRNVVAARLPRSDPRAGIFGYDQIAKPGDITDGLSQTIMIVGTGAVAAPWVQGGGATIRGARQPYFDKFTGTGSRGLAKTGTLVLFADGSARMISADVDPEIYKAMCTMHGAEQIDLSKLVTQGP